MRNTPTGYTLLEVMIFLAVSGLLLVAAMMTVGNQQAHTEFRNSMNDVNTKMQQWIDQVVNGFTGSTAIAGAPSFTCSAPGNNPPVLSPASSRERGSNPECIFLGKAIHVNTSDSFSDKITAYQIIGKRTFTSGGDTAVVDSLQRSQPIAAIDNVDLTEEYQIPNGTRIVSVRSGNTLNERSTMAGIFTSLNTESNARENGSLSLMSVQYPLNINADPKNTLVKDCIRLISIQCAPTVPITQANPWPMNQWQICFGSTKSDDRALLTLTSNQGRGVTVRVTMDSSCS